MTTKQQILELLEKWNFPILHEEERSIVFRYQMNYIQINLYEGDDGRVVAVTLAGLFNADNEEKFFTAIRTCNQLNYSMLHVKLYLDADNDVIIASELFLAPDADMEFTLTKSLESVTGAKKQFLRQYKEYEADTLLLSDLESDPDSLDDPEESE